MAPWWARGRGFGGGGKLQFFPPGFCLSSLVLVSGDGSPRSRIGGTAENLIFGLDPNQECDTPCTLWCPRVSLKELLNLIFLINSKCHVDRAESNSSKSKGVDLAVQPETAQEAFSPRVLLTLTALFSKPCNKGRASGRHVLAVTRPGRWAHLDVSHIWSTQGEKGHSLGCG